MFQRHCMSLSSTSTIPLKPTTAGSKHGCRRCEIETLPVRSDLGRRHAFVQNVRRGHYEIGTGEAAHHRLRIAFDAFAVFWNHRPQRSPLSTIGQRNTAVRLLGAAVTGEG